MLSLWVSSISWLPLSVAVPDIIDTTMSDTSILNETPQEYLMYTVCLWLLLPGMWIYSNEIWGSIGFVYMEIQISIQVKVPCKEIMMYLK